jgi:hypothetical protein
VVSGCCTMEQFAPRSVFSHGRNAQITSSCDGGYFFIGYKPVRRAG